MFPKWDRVYLISCPPSPLCSIHTILWPQMHLGSFLPQIFTPTKTSFWTRLPPIFQWAKSFRFQLKSYFPKKVSFSFFCLILDSPLITSHHIHCFSFYLTGFFFICNDLVMCVILFVCWISGSPSCRWKAPWIQGLYLFCSL